MLWPRCLYLETFWPRCLYLRNVLGQISVPQLFWPSQMSAPQHVMAQPDDCTLKCSGLPRCLYLKCSGPARCLYLENVGSHAHTGVDVGRVVGLAECEQNKDWAFGGTGYPADADGDRLGELPRSRSERQRRFMEEMPPTIAEYAP
jgi:hypothetical protein